MGTQLPGTSTAPQYPVPLPSYGRSPASSSSFASYPYGLYYCTSPSPLLPYGGGQQPSAYPQAPMPPAAYPSFPTTTGTPSFYPAVPGGYSVPAAYPLFPSPYAAAARAYSQPLPGGYPQAMTGYPHPMTSFSQSTSGYLQATPGYSQSMARYPSFPVAVVYSSYAQTADAAEAPSSQPLTAPAAEVAPELPDPHSPDSLMLASLKCICASKLGDLNSLLRHQKQLAEAFANVVQHKKKKGKPSAASALTKSIDLDGLFGETTFLANYLDEAIEGSGDIGLIALAPHVQLSKLLQRSFISSYVRFSNANSEASKMFDRLVADPDWRKATSRTTAAAAAPGRDPTDTPDSTNLTRKISMLRLSACLLFSEIAQHLDASKEATAACSTEMRAQLSLISEIPLWLEKSAARHRAALIEIRNIKGFPPDRDALWLSREFFMKDNFYINGTLRPQYLLLLFDDMLVITKTDEQYPSLQRFISRTFLKSTSSVNKKERALVFQEGSFQCQLLLLQPVDESKLDRWFHRLEDLIALIREREYSLSLDKWNSKRKA